VTGYVKQLAEEKYGCIISQHSQVRTRPEFDLLINRGNGAKVEWTKWEKLSPFYKYNGLVSTGNGASNVSLKLIFGDNFHLKPTTK
jgi:hypothetical protein